jgi:regulatory protein YycI of two-component signal transduction system YycFG
MDWKLAKSLYIIVFLLINIFLIIIYMNAREGDESETAETHNILDETNIDMSEVEDYEPVEMNILTAVVHNFTTSDEEIAAEDMENQHQIRKEFNDDGPLLDQTELQQYKEEEVYQGESYQYDEVMSTQTQIIFNQMYEDFPIFNHEAARILFSGKGSNAEIMEQTLIDNIEENAYSVPTTAKSPLECVESLYRMERISEDAIIRSARLGYYIILVEDDQVMMRPKWEFNIEDQGVEQTIYVDATSDSEEIIESE